MKFYQTETRPGDTLLSIAIREYGNAEGQYLILADNPQLSDDLTGELDAGAWLNIRTGDDAAAPIPYFPELEQARKGKQYTIVRIEGNEGGSSEAAHLLHYDGTAYIDVASGGTQVLPSAKVRQAGVVVKQLRNAETYDVVLPVPPTLAEQVATSSSAQVHAALVSAGKNNSILVSGEEVIRNYNSLALAEQRKAYFGTGGWTGIAAFNSINFNCTAAMAGGVGVTPKFTYPIKILQRNVRPEDNATNIHYVVSGVGRPGGAETFYSLDFQVNIGETLAIYYTKVNAGLAASVQIFGSFLQTTINVSVGSFEPEVEAYKGLVGTATNEYILALNNLISSWRGDGYKSYVKCFVPLAVEHLGQCKNVLSDSFHASFVNPPALTSPKKYLQFDGATQYINTNVYPKVVGQRPADFDTEHGIMGIRVVNNVASDIAIMGALGQSGILSFGIHPKITGGSPQSQVYFGGNATVRAAAPTSTAARAVAVYRNDTDLKLIVDGNISASTSVAAADNTKNLGFIAVGGRSASGGGMQDFNGSQQVAYYYFADTGLLPYMAQFYASCNQWLTEVNSI